MALPWQCTGAALHLGGKVTLLELLTPALAAKHLGENIKNPALTNLAFTGASHIYGITESGIFKLCQLHWWQNILVKIHNKIWQSQWQQNTFHENTKNLAFQHCGNHTGSKTLGENIKNLALTNPTYTVASHFARISKCGIAKLLQLHWQQSTLTKISKIWHSQTQHTQQEVTLLELPNLAMPNSSNCTGSKTSC